MKNKQLFFTISLLIACGLAPATYAMEKDAITAQTKEPKSLQDLCNQSVAQSDNVVDCVKHIRERELPVETADQIIMQTPQDTITQKAADFAQLLYSGLISDMAKVQLLKKLPTQNVDAIYEQLPHNVQCAVIETHESYQTTDKIKEVAEQGTITPEIATISANLLNASTIEKLQEGTLYHDAMLAHGNEQLLIRANLDTWNSWLKSITNNNLFSCPEEKEMDENEKSMAEEILNKNPQYYATTTNGNTIIITNKEKTDSVTIFDSHIAEMIKNTENKQTPATISADKQFVAIVDNASEKLTFHAIIFDVHKNKPVINVVRSDVQKITRILFDYNDHCLITENPSGEIKILELPAKYIHDNLTLAEIVAIRLGSAKEVQETNVFTTIPSNIVLSLIIQEIFPLINQETIAISQAQTDRMIEGVKREINNLVERTGNEKTKKEFLFMVLRNIQQTNRTCDEWAIQLQKQINYSNNVKNLPQKLVNLRNKYVNLRIALLPELKKIEESTTPEEIAQFIEEAGLYQIERLAS